MTDKPIKIAFGEPTHISVYGPEFPREITNQILEKEKIPPVGQLGSSMIEDFIIEKMSKGNTSTEGIVQDFFNEGVPAKIQGFINMVHEISENMNWKRVFNERDASEAQTAVLLEMKRIGMTKKQIEKIAKIKTIIQEGIGFSSHGEGTVYASRLQAVRRAIDYVTVFGKESTVEEVTRAFLASTIAHELGHEIDEVAGIATNTIHYEWRSDDTYVDSRGERFAQYWGNIPFKDDEKSKRISEREWLVQLTKTKEMWDSLREYNSAHDEKIDLLAVFRGIDEKLDRSRQVNISALLNARMAIYHAVPIENYASPYSQEVVEEAIKTSQKTTTL